MNPDQLMIYNLKGECVFLKVGRGQGWFELAWDGAYTRSRRVASGIYLLRFVSGKHRDVRKLVLI